MVTKIATEIGIAEEVCINCGVHYWIESVLQERRKKNHQGICCPNGHSQYYPAKSDIELLQEENNALRTKVQKTEKQLNGTLQELNRINNRVNNGVCPKCHRHFENLEKHMKCKHKGVKSGN